MPSQAEPTATLLDHCIDDLLDGRDWNRRLPSEPSARARLSELMEAAVAVYEAAASTPRMESPRRARLWSRIARNSKTISRLRAIAFYRLPYLPPLWIRPEAC